MKTKKLLKHQRRLVEDLCQLYERLGSCKYAHHKQKNNMMTTMSNLQRQIINIEVKLFTGEEMHQEGKE